MLVLYLELCCPIPPTDAVPISETEHALSDVFGTLVPLGELLLFPPLRLLLCCPMNVRSPATTCSAAFKELFNRGQSDADTFSKKRQCS